MGTLSLKKESPPQSAETEDFEIPQFDPDAHHGEVMGVDGVRWVQGRNYFDNLQRFVKQAPKEAWMAPLTADQEIDRRQRVAHNRRVALGRRTAEAPLPEHVIRSRQENARAEAAERAQG